MPPAVVYNENLYQQQGFGAPINNNSNFLDNLRNMSMMQPASYGNTLNDFLFQSPMQQQQQQQIFHPALYIENKRNLLILIF